MSRRSRRISVIARYMAVGAIITQLGPLCTIGNSALTSGIGRSGVLIDPEGRLFGVLNVCGTPNIQGVDADGNAIGDTINAGDDLLYGCPSTAVLGTVGDNAGGGT